MQSWHSYPSIFNLGHRMVRDLLNGPVLVEEKVDGSQFSFGVDDETSEIKIRSKGCQMNIEAPEKMFQLAVNTVIELAPILHRGWTYRAEYLAKPKHNTLIYTRIPNKHLIVFDINTGDECYLPYEEKAAEAARIGLEVVPKIYEGEIKTIEEFRKFLETDSILGGQKVEGVVIKPVGYGLFGQDKKCVLGKFVSEAFKEAHSHEWRTSNPTQNDILYKLQMEYAVEARWMKAVQHLKEAGKLQDSPSDIGLLLKEVKEDIAKECEDEIKEKLYKWAKDHVLRGSTAGLPEWYKEKLLKLQFEHQEAC